MNHLETIEHLTEVIKKQADIILSLYFELSQHVGIQELEKCSGYIQGAQGRFFNWEGIDDC